MQITAIEPRRKSLSALFLDGELAASIDTETLLRSGYRLGDEIDDAQLFDLMQASNARRANEKALFLLAHRSHSKHELAEKLKRTVGEEAAQAAADHMEELGLINDETYARDYAADLFRRKGFAPQRIRQEMLQKGIDRERIEIIIEELAPDPEERLQELVERKYVTSLRDEKGIRRTIAALQRYGYPYGMIRRVLSQWKPENEDEEYDGI